MKKVLATILTLVCLLCCSFVLAACGSSPEGTGDGTPTHTSHSWMPAWESNDTHHWHNCYGCSEKGSYAEHNFTSGDCVCGKKVSHTHTYSLEWTQDDAYHWHASTCDHVNEVKDKSAHDFTNGTCICGKKKPSAARGALNAMAVAYSNADLGGLAALVYGRGTAGYDVFVHSTDAGIFFQGYKRMEIKSVELLYEDDVDTGFSVIASLTYETEIKDNSKTDTIDLKGNIYFVYKHNEWRLTEVPVVNIVSKTISTRENDGAELYFGDNIYTTVPVFAEIAEQDGNSSYKITVPTESSSLKIGNYFKCYNGRDWSLVTKVNNGYQGWSPATEVFSFQLSLQWKIEVYDDNGELAEEWDLKFLKKKDITVTFYDYDRETVVASQTFKQYKKATSESAPSHSDATFVGWTTYDGILFDFTQRLSVETSLYAAYETAGTKDITRAIAAIGELKLEDKAELNRLKNAVDTLSDEDKIFVYNKSKLDRVLSDMVALEWEMQYDFNGYYRIIKYKGLDDIVHVPSALGIMPVRAIDGNAFRGKPIKELYIPDGLIYIGDQSGSLDNAIIYCTVMGRPNGYNEHFAGNGTVIWNVRDTVTVGDMVFVLHDDDTATLAKVYSTDNGDLVIPKEVQSYSVTKMTDGALDGLQIQTLEIPFSLLFSLSIDHVNALTVRDVDDIRSDSFASIKNTTISSLVLVGAATVMPANAFKDFANLGGVVMTNTMTSIGNSAFYGCVSLDAMSIPDSVTTIEVNAFGYCTGLERITIPDSVVSIGNNAFASCNALTIYCETTKKPSGWNSSWNSDRPVVWDCKNNDKDANGYAYAVIGSVRYALKNGVATVARQPKIISGDIVIPDCVTYKDSSFEVASIAEYAFYGCTGLTSVTIPNSIITIGVRVFSGCTELKRIEISNSVTNILNDAFSGCDSLADIYYLGSVTDWCGISGLDYLMGTDRTLHINGEVLGGKLMIPNSVTSIAGYAFYGCTGITSITIPNSVTAIGNVAFAGCNNLMAIYYLGSAADWCGISGLGSLMKTGGTLHINGEVLRGDLMIPDSVTSIASYAFYGCTGLTSITIPNSVASIGSNAYTDCRALTIYCEETAKPSGWSNSWNCGHPVVWDCENHDRDESGYAYAVIGSVRYALKNGVATVEIQPGNISGDIKILDCVTYKNLSFEVTAIKFNAFYDCTELTSIIIPHSINEIGANAFYRCTELKDIYYLGSVADWCGISGLEYLMTTDRTLHIDEHVLVGTLTIPDSVEYIAPYAFYSCTGLTGVTIPNSVTYIDDYAFYGCTGLTSVTIPDSVTSMKDHTFSGCRALTIYCEKTERPRGWNFNWIAERPVVWNCRNNDKDTNGYAYAVIGSIRYALKDGRARVEVQTGIIGGSISIPDCVTYRDSSFEVTSIADGAFYGCTGLISITIPASVTFIGRDAFKDCYALTIYCEMTKRTLNSSYSWSDACPVVWDCKNNDKDAKGYAYAVIGSIRYALKDGVATVERQIDSIHGDVVVPGYVTYKDSSFEVTTIGYCAFFGCAGLTSITIPNSVTTIERSAFYGCTGLTSITIPNSVTAIEGSAFYGCTGLASITIPNSVTTIEYQAFYGCTGLTSITIPSSVTTLDVSVFYGCTGLTNITFNGTMEQWRSIIKEHGWDQYAGDYTVTCTDGTIA